VPLHIAFGVHSAFHFLETSCGPALDSATFTRGGVHMPLDTSNTPKSWSKIGQTTAENMKALQARAKELGEEEALNKAVKNLTRTTAEPKPRPQNKESKGMSATELTPKQKWEKRAPAKTNAVIKGIGQLIGYIESDNYTPDQKQAGYIAAAINDALKDYKKAVKKRFAETSTEATEETGFSFEKYAKKAEDKRG